MIIVAYTYVATPIKCNSLIDCFARCRLPACLPACLPAYTQRNSFNQMMMRRGSSQNLAQAIGKSQPKQWLAVNPAATIQKVPIIILL